MTRRKRGTPAFHADIGTEDRTRYTEEERQWLVAIDRMVRRIAPRRPDGRDVLEVAKALGYQRPEK